MLYFFILIGIQIISESLPISSSGHIVLFEHFSRFFIPSSVVSVPHDSIVSHFLHGPTALVLALFFWDRWWFLLVHFRRYFIIIVKLVFFAFVADCVTAFFYVFIQEPFCFSLFPVGLGFACSAFFLLSLKFCNIKQYEKITFLKAVILGFLQGIALLPGVSRFALTFCGACWLGIAPRRAFEFSFAMQWPLIIAGFSNSLRFLLGSHIVIDDVNLFDMHTLLVILFYSVIAFFALLLVQTLVMKKRVWLFSFVLLFSFISWAVLVFFC